MLRQLNIENSYFGPSQVILEPGSISCRNVRTTTETKITSRDYWTDATVEYTTCEFSRRTHGRAQLKGVRILDTSLSLLDRLRNAPSDTDWSRLIELYGPLLRSWLLQSDVQAADADDLVQEVLLVIHRELPNFQHNQRPGAFRRWLRQIVVHRLRNFWRSRGRLAAIGADSQWEERLRQLEDDGSHLSQLWDREHNLAVVTKLLELIESRFTDSTRLVFRRLVLDGADADMVAAETGQSLNAIFTAKSRVLRELRRLGQGLLD